MKHPRTSVAGSLALLLCCLMTLGFAPPQAFSQAPPTPAPPTPAPTVGPTVGPPVGPPGATPTPGAPGATPTPGAPGATPTPGAPGATPTPGAPPTPSPTVAPPGTILPTPTPVTGTGCTNYTLTATTGVAMVPGVTDIGVPSDSTQSIVLPFSYSLYDESYNTVTVGAHGNLQFASNRVDFNPTCLPTLGFDHAIFAYHDHLHTDNFFGPGVGTFNYGVYTSVSGVAPNRIFNIEWRAYAYFQNTNENFEIRLYEGVRRFDVIYGAMGDGGNFGAVGVQKNARSCYTQYSCRQGGVFAGLQLSFLGQDLIAPTIFIGSPSPGSTVTSLQEISGQADDNFGGSGISSVGVTLRRDSDGAYWNGSAFVGTPVTLPTMITGDNFVVTAPLPSDANLTPGSYTITATAYDIGGNSATSTVSITIGVPDTTPPAVTITSPKDFAKLTTFPFIFGTATDEAKGTGLDHVNLIIQRQTDDAYWTGTTWNPSPTLLTTNLNGNRWSRTFLLPSGNDLVDSAYQIFAYATDKIGNSSGVAVLINVDRTRPSSVLFTTPIGGATTNQFNLIQGTATDAPNGTGIDHVNIFLQRSDGYYYNGTTFVATSTSLPAIISRSPRLPDDTVNFTLRKLPTGASLKDGRYILKAVAVDKVGNQTGRTISFTYNKVDRTSPTVTFTSPKPNAFVTTLAPITGTVADNPGGSGVARVDLTIQRASDGKFWTGSAWGIPIAEAKLTTVLIARTTPTTWSRTSGLPTGVNLQNGKYTLVATGYDRAGNHAAVTETVTVRGSTAKSVGIASSIALSTATAQSATNSLQLRFGAALDAESASDAAHYAVQVNGHSVGVQSAAYNATTHTVVLDLGTGALRSGDHVAVAWQGVLDTQGQEVAGKSSSVTAQ